MATQSPTREQQQARIAATTFVVRIRNGATGKVRNVTTQAASLGDAIDQAAEVYVLMHDENVDHQVVEVMFAGSVVWAEQDEARSVREHRITPHGNVVRVMAPLVVPAELLEGLRSTPWCRCDTDAGDALDAAVYFEGGADAERLGWSHGWKCRTCNGLVQGG